MNNKLQQMYIELEAIEQALERALFRYQAQVLEKKRILLMQEIKNERKRTIER